MDRWCFRKSLRPKPWHDALTECQALDGGLVEVTSVDKQQAFENYISSEPSKAIIHIYIIKYSKNQNCFDAVSLRCSPINTTTSVLIFIF